MACRLHVYSFTHTFTHTKTHTHTQTHTVPTYMSRVVYECRGGGLRWVVKVKNKGYSRPGLGEAHGEQHVQAGAVFDSAWPGLALPPRSNFGVKLLFRCHCSPAHLMGHYSRGLASFRHVRAVKHEQTGPNRAKQPAQCSWNKRGRGRGAACTRDTGSPSEQVPPRSRCFSRFYT